MTSPADLPIATPLPRWTRRSWAWWLGTVGSIALLMATYRHVDQLKSGRGWPFLRPLTDEATAVLGAGLLFFGVRALVHRWPLSRQTWARLLPLYGVCLVVFSLLHTTMNWGSRSLLYPLFGYGRYNYGPMPMPYLMELPIDLLIFTMMVAVLLAARQAERMRSQALESARLSKALAEARLDALTRSLEPHFLFNSLNTISATMYRDLEAADQMIEHLGDLLRAALSGRKTGEVTVGEELTTLEPYLALLRARFEDRLELELDVDDEVRNARTPVLLLQPLIENSVRHGVEKRGAGLVEVRIGRVGETLEVVVDDDGPGMPSEIDPLQAGHGLRTTAERLRLLYGEGQTLEAGNRSEGGFRVTVRLPYDGTRPSP